MPTYPPVYAIPARLNRNGIAWNQLADTFNAKRDALRVYQNDPSDENWAAAENKRNEWKTLLHHWTENQK